MTKETNSIVVPTCPKDQKEIRLVIEEISNSKSRAEAESEYQKEAIKELAERFEIPAKQIKAMVMDYHKNTFDKKVAENEDYVILYETIMKPSSSKVDDDFDDDFDDLDVTEEIDD